MTLEDAPFDDLQDWNEMAARIHSNNVAKGFWPGGVAARNVGEALALIHSELTEAYLALQDNGPDDKLPQLLGVEVELADAIIRNLDLGGAYAVDFNDLSLVEVNTPDSYSSLAEDLLVGHAIVSEILEAHRKNQPEFGALIVKLHIYLLEVMHKYDMYVGAIELKVEFNETRPYKHGKSY